MLSIPETYDKGKSTFVMRTDESKKQHPVMGCCFLPNQIFLLTAIIQNSENVDGFVFIIYEIERCIIFNRDFSAPQLRIRFFADDHTAVRHAFKGQHLFFNRKVNSFGDRWFSQDIGNIGKDMEQILLCRLFNDNLKFRQSRTSFLHRQIRH